MVSALVKALTTVFTTLLKIWKPIIFIVGFALIIVFSIGWIFAIIGFFIALPFAEYFVTGPKFISFLATLNAFVVVSFPVLGLAFLTARLAFNKRMSAHWSAGIWSFWVLNIISLFAIASSQARYFNSGNDITRDLDLTSINSDTLVIRMQENPYSGELISLGDLQVTDGLLVSHNVHLELIKSDGVNFELKQVNRSKGRNNKAANDIAGAINYNYNLSGNVISLPEIFTIDKATKWRNQTVELSLYVPVGKTIRFENNANELIDYEGFNFDEETEQPWPESDQYWVMGSNGLVNIDWAKRNKMSEEYQFTDFSKLQFEGEMEVVIEKGDNFKVSVNGNENYIKQVEVAQLEKTLSFITDIEDLSSPVRVFVTMPSLQSLDIRNTDEVDVKGFTEKSMRLKNDGSNVLKAFINVDSLFLVQDGEGEINVRGNGKYLKADLHNQGRIDTERFNVNSAEIKAMDFSEISVAVSEIIRISKDESSKVNIEGEPQVIDTGKKNID